VGGGGGGWYTVGLTVLSHARLQTVELLYCRKPLHFFAVVFLSSTAPFLASQLCTAHILADVGKREVKLLEICNLKSFA
jgi:hypothetical protein